MRLNGYNAIDALIDYEDASLHFAREVSCFATIEHGIISSTTSNSSGSVEFDFFSIWETLKKSAVRGRVAYMIHSHPPKFNRMSTIDYNMVYGWCMAIGIPIWFLVITPDEVTSYLCGLNRETKTVDNTLVDISNHYNLITDLRIIANVIYGMSKADRIEQEDINKVVEYIENSKLDWRKIHDWNLNRQWNQITYTE